MEIWKYFGDTYKVYSEDKTIIASIAKLKGCELSAQYFDRNMRLIGQDIIVPKSKIDFVKRMLVKNNAA